MSKADKLLESLLGGAADHNFTFDDAAYLLQKIGAKVRPGKGSHICFVLDGKLFNLQKKGVRRKLTRSRRFAIM